MRHGRIQDNFREDLPLRCAKALRRTDEQRVRRLDAVDDVRHERNERRIGNERDFRCLADTEPDEEDRQECEDRDGPDHIENRGKDVVHITAHRDGEAEDKRDDDADGKACNHAEEADADVRDERAVHEVLPARLDHHERRRQEHGVEPVRLAVEIADDLLPWNNGTFVIDFEKGHCALTDKNPQYHLSMSIGTFTTLLLGYKSAEKLLQMGKIQTTYEAVAKLDDILYHEIPYVSDYI